MKQLWFVSAALSSVGILASSTPAWAQDITPPKVYTMTPGGVSLADGSFTFTDTDLVIGDLTLERFHLGGRKDPNTPFFGPRMSHNYDIFVAPNPRTSCPSGVSCTMHKRPVVHMGTSASGSYIETLPPHYYVDHNNLDGLKGTLTHAAGSPYVYTDQDGDVYTFSATVTARGVSSDSRRIDNIIFANGRRHDFAYNAAGDLKAVISSTGYAIVFDYAAPGRVSIACGYNRSQYYVSVSSTCNGAALQVQYGYSAETTPKLTSVTDVRGGITTYTYDRNEIACVKPPEYASCKISNVYGDSQDVWQVTEQTLAGSETWYFQFLGNYSSSRDSDAYVEAEPWYHVNVQDPAGKVSVYTFAQTSPYGHTDPTGRTTSYRYGGGWNFDSASDVSQNYGSSLMEVTFPEGNRYTAVYAGPRRAVTKETLLAKPGSNLAPLVKEYGYPTDCVTAPNTPQTCAKPVWIRDPKGNQTDFGYFSWGGMQWEMQPAPAPGGARPLKLFGYVQKFAYVRNASGGLAASGALHWVPATETVCQTYAGSSSPVCDPAAPQMVTSFEYGPDGTADNLLLRGRVVSADGVSLRTCYGYDQWGNKIFETQPKAGLASCS